MFSKQNYLFKGLILLSLLAIILTGCEQAEEEEKVENKYSDGSYIAYSDATDHGYAWAKVSIENDKITEVNLMEVTSRGNHKDYDTYDYEPSVKAYEEMPERFVEANSSEVEIYSGATHSSEKFIQAVERSLQIAGDETEGKYFSGTFQGKSEKVSAYGYAVALVTIEDDEITEVDLMEVNKDDEFRDYSTYDYEPAVKANQEMAKRFVENNSADVDTYTGATDSSEKYIEAVKNAFLHASKEEKSDEKSDDIKE